MVCLTGGMSQLEEQRQQNFHIVFDGFAFFSSIEKE